MEVILQADRKSNVYKLKGVTESENLTETTIITNKGNYSGNSNNSR